MVGWTLRMRRGSRGSVGRVRAWANRNAQSTWTWHTQGGAIEIGMARVKDDAVKAAGSSPDHPKGLMDARTLDMQLGVGCGKAGVLEEHRQRERDRG